MMDLLNDCEWSLMEFSDCLLVTFESLEYSKTTYQEAASGIGHKSFEFYYN